MRSDLLPRPWVGGVVLVSVVGVAWACGQGVHAGVFERGIGALVWVPVLASAHYFGRVPGLGAALLASTAFYFFVVLPPEGGAWPWSAWAALTAMMGLAVWAITARQEGARSRALVVVFWNEAPSGDYRADCARGEMRAAEFIHRLNAERDYCLLGFMVRDMVYAGRFNGPEVGFFDRLSTRLMRPVRSNGIDNHTHHFDGKLGVIEAQPRDKAAPIGDDRVWGQELVQH